MLFLIVACLFVHAYILWIDIWVEFELEGGMEGLGL